LSPQEVNVNTTLDVLKAQSVSGPPKITFRELGD
jgi:hypothetical protein